MKAITLHTVLFSLSIPLKASATPENLVLSISPRSFFTATIGQFPITHMRRLDWGFWDFTVDAKVVFLIEFSVPGHRGKSVDNLTTETSIAAPKGILTTAFPPDSTIRLNLKEVIERIQQKRSDITVTGISIQSIIIGITNSMVNVAAYILNPEAANLITEPAIEMKWPIVMNNQYGEDFQFEVELKPIQ